jgi:hypothetical protein
LWLYLSCLACCITWSVWNILYYRPLLLWFIVGAAGSPPSLTIPSLDHSTGRMRRPVFRLHIDPNWGQWRFLYASRRGNRYWRHRFPPSIVHIFSLFMESGCEYSESAIDSLAGASGEDGADMAAPRMPGGLGCLPQEFRHPMLPQGRNQIFVIPSRASSLLL